MIDISHVANEAKKAGQDVHADVKREEDSNGGKEHVKISFTPLGQTEAGKKMIARYSGPKTKDTKDEKPSTNSEEPRPEDQELRAQQSLANPTM